MVLGARSAIIMNKCTYPHFSHFSALLTPIWQGGRNVCGTFSFRGGKVRKNAISMKKRILLISTPQDGEKRGSSSKTAQSDILV